MGCLAPPLTKVPKGKWFCPLCERDGVAQNEDFSNSAEPPTYPERTSHRRAPFEAPSEEEGGSDSVSEDGHADEPKLEKKGPRRSSSRLGKQSISIAETRSQACDICAMRIDAEDDVLVVCSECGVPVHKECYGLRVVPKGTWTCEACVSGPRRSICVLCTKTGGALKRLSDKSNVQYAHVACALWLPGTAFQDERYRRGILVESVDKNLFSLKCCLCKQKGGTCVCCEHQGCPKSFHVSCGLKDAAFKVGMFVDLEGKKHICCDSHAPHP